MDAYAQVAGTPLGGGSPPIDMSVYGLFMQADWVVKAVMIGLILASLGSWAVIIDKLFRFSSLNSAANEICVWLPTPELATVTSSGRALASAMSSFSVFHFESPRTATTSGRTCCSPGWTWPTGRWGSRRGSARRSGRCPG